MKTYRARGTGEEVRALRWVGQLSSAPTDYDVSVEDGTRTLYVELPDSPVELEVLVGQYLVELPGGLLRAMEPEEFFDAVEQVEQVAS